MREREMLRKNVERWLRIWNYRKPVIAQVHSYCLSGGLDLLSTTDLTFAAAGTRFGHPASRAVGIPVMLGMLPLKIGAQKTKRILFTGDLIDAEEAERWGLVDWVCAPDELDKRTMEYCRRVAKLPMDALTVHKHVVNRWSELMGARTGAYESADFDVLYHTTPSCPAMLAITTPAPPGAITAPNASRTSATPSRSTRRIASTGAWTGDRPAVCTTCVTRPRLAASAASSATDAWSDTSTCRARTRWPSSVSASATRLRVDSSWSASSTVRPGPWRRAITRPTPPTPITTNTSGLMGHLRKGEATPTPYETNRCSVNAALSYQPGCTS